MPNPWGTMVSGSDIYHTARLKTYPGGRVEVLVCDKAIFGGDGWEEHGKERRPRGRKKISIHAPREGSDSDSHQNTASDFGENASVFTVEKKIRPKCNFRLKGKPEFL